MKRLATVMFVFIVCVGLMGCADKRLFTNDIDLFPGDVPLGYSDCAGSIEVKTAVGNYAHNLDSNRVTLQYRVRTDGDDLLWDMEVNGQLYGIVDGKLLEAKTPMDFFRMYNLKDSHPKLRFEVRTNRLGEPLSFGDFVVVETGAVYESEPIAKFYPDLFSAIIVPFVAPRGQVGGLVSRGKCMIPFGYQKNYEQIDVVLNGRSSDDGADCLVLAYEGDSVEYKDRNRKKNIDHFRMMMLLDAETRVLRKAKGVLRRNKRSQYIFIEATGVPLPQ